ncbi:MAG TPA: DUF2007 domain-containing protein [Planctomicrobium sp.]|nr:DUF2007 domain-containing protein [Planctomicrobium sp.]
MTTEQLVPVYESSNVGQLEVIRMALEDSGIRCSIENENQAGLSGVLQSRLFVLEKDADAARGFIEEVEAERSHHQDDPELMDD